jgi:hypothetical protein
MPSAGSLGILRQPHLLQSFFFNVAIYLRKDSSRPVTAKQWGRTTRKQLVAFCKNNHILSLIPVTETPQFLMLSTELEKDIEDFSPDDVPLGDGAQFAEVLARTQPEDVMDTINSLKSNLQDIDTQVRSFCIRLGFTGLLGLSH